MKCLTIFLFALLNYVNSAEYRVDPLVLTDQGLIRGLKASDGSYSSFLGVPYASIDSANPFGPALHHDGFNGEVFNAYDGSTKCPQSLSLSKRSSKSQDESLDCLKLNIYSPILASSQNPLPVLVWIHGGDFALGSAGDYNPEKLVKQGILVVTVNYRLGPYGFMCLDIPSVPGNQGLKDQYEALHWVRSNIRSFGGNPYNITIAGQEAGSSSVLFHLYSDKEKLYNKVILESGTPQNIGMFANSDANAATKLALHLGFDTEDTEEALNFLGQSSHELVAAAAADLNLQLKPCREKSFSGVENFIESESPALSNPKKVKNTPVLIGHTSKESLNKNNNYENDPFYENIKENFNLEEDKLSEAAEIVKHFYIGDEEISDAPKSQLVDFNSDVSVNHPTQRTITKLLNENASPVYEYEFSYVGNSNAEGAANGEELKYLFEIANSSLEDEEDSLISNRMVSLWTNFIKYGNPTPQKSDLLPITWTPLTSQTRPYLVINSDLEIKGRINYERMAFWDLFYSLYGKHNKFSRECNM